VAPIGIFCAGYRKTFLLIEINNTFDEKLLDDQEKSQFGIKTSINRKTGISLGFGFGFRLNDEFDDDEDED